MHAFAALGRQVASPLRELLVPEAEIRSAAAVANNVQGQAAIAAHGPAKRTARVRHRSVVRQVSGFEVMVTRDAASW